MSLPVLKILVDDEAEKGLLSEHGFAVWIDAGGKHILFDTGQGRALKPNTRHTRYDPAKADMLVLSHGHYDHTGAVDYVLECNPKIDVYAHLGIFRERYSLHLGQPPKEISMPSEQRLVVANLRDSQLNWVTKPTRIAEGVWLSGPIPRTHVHEDVGGPFFRDAGGTEPDPIEDDLSMWIETPEGIVVVCGCCHSGLMNTLDYICRVSGIDRIRGVVGGFHLKQASEERLAATVKALQGIKPDLVVPCHCTGAAAIDYLTEHLAIEIKPGFAGFELNTGEFK